MNTYVMAKKAKPEVVVSSSQGKPAKRVLQEHVDARRDRYGCSDHPEVYDWLYGARTQTVGNKPIEIKGNGNYHGEKLRALARDGKSRVCFEQAFGAGITIEDDGKNITLLMTFDRPREQRGVSNFAASAAAA